MFACWYTSLMWELYSALSLTLAVRQSAEKPEVSVTLRGIPDEQA